MNDYYRGLPEFGAIAAIGGIGYALYLFYQYSPYVFVLVFVLTLAFIYWVGKQT